MPYIAIQITRENVSTEQKRELIRGATDLMVRVLGKDPALTFVVIEEIDTDNWGVAGVPVSEARGSAPPMNMQAPSSGLESRGDFIQGADT